MTCDKECADCGKNPGIWEIHARKEVQGTFPEKDGLFCDDCLMLALEGYRTGGGYTIDCIDKIVRHVINNYQESCVKIEAVGDA